MAANLTEREKALYQLAEEASKRYWSLKDSSQEEDYRTAIAKVCGYDKEIMSGVGKILHQRRQIAKLRRLAKEEKRGTEKAKPLAKQEELF